VKQAKDSIDSSPLGDIEAFKFDDKVAAVFQDISIVNASIVAWK